MGVVHSSQAGVLRLREVRGLSRGLRTCDLQRRGADPDVAAVRGFPVAWSPSHFMYGKKKNQRSKWNCVLSRDPFYLLSGGIANCKISAEQI